MGNQTTFQQQQRTWQKLSTLKYLPGSPILVRQQSSLQGEQYQINIQSIRLAYQRANLEAPYCQCINIDTIKQSQQYEQRRKQAQNVVKILNFKFSPLFYDFINEHANYTIITERIHYRLKDLDGITRQQGFYILYHALKGYSYIAKAGKMGYVTSQMIGITESADIKVWINSCWASNYPQKPLRSQKQNWMIDELIYTIQQEVRKTNKKGFGNKFSSQYSSSKKQFNTIISWVYQFSNYQENEKSAKQNLKLKILSNLKKREQFDKKILLKAKKTIDIDFDDKIQTSTYLKGCKSTLFSTKKIINQRDFIVDLKQSKKISISERRNQTQRIPTKHLRYRQSSVRQIKRNSSNNLNMTYQHLQNARVIRQQQQSQVTTSSQYQQKIIPLKICFNFFTPSHRQCTPNIRYFQQNRIQINNDPIISFKSTSAGLTNKSLKIFSQDVDRKTGPKNLFENQSKESVPKHQRKKDELKLNSQNLDQQYSQCSEKKFKPYQYNNQKQNRQSNLRFTFTSDQDPKSHKVNNCLAHSASEKDLIEHIPVKQQSHTLPKQQTKTQQYLRDFHYYLQAYHPEDSQLHSATQPSVSEDKSLTIIYQSSQVDQLHN